MSSFDISSLITRINPFSNKKGGGMEKERTVILIVIIAMASFFGFYPLFAEFKEPAAQAFGAAIFGTIFTIVLTMFLLKTQTEVSETSDRQQTVFQEKVKLFNKIIDKLERCFKDNKISAAEKPELQFIMFKLQMIASDATIYCYRDFLEGIFEDEDNDPNAEDIPVQPEHRKKLIEFTKLCRKELGLPEVLEGQVRKSDEEKAEQDTKIVNTLETADAIKEGKRTTYETWDEFAREQRAKDPLRERFMPIAKNVHDLIKETFDENGMQYNCRYGDGTFSFSVPEKLAKSRKRTCARFGLINLRKDSCYFDYLYKDAGANLPNNEAKLMNEDPERYGYGFAKPADFEKVKKDLKEGIVRSYNILAIRPAKK